MKGKGIAISSGEALELNKSNTQVSLFSNEFPDQFRVYIYINFKRDFENCIMFLTFDPLITFTTYHCLKKGRVNWYKNSLYSLYSYYYSNYNCFYYYQIKL